MSDVTKANETSSKEVVNQFRSCRDLSDIVPLYVPRALYLKPVAKVNVSVSLPQLKTPGKTISTWEVMSKIRALILPDEFASLKVVKSTLEFIRLEGDLRDRCRLQRVLARLDSQRLKLTGFPSLLKVRVAEAKDDFPNRHTWDSYFRDAKHMNELKPGERPDTIHISGLPVKWFCMDGSNRPCESLVAKIFKKWGTVRRVDVPAADPYRSRMRLGNNIQKFSYEDGVFFDAYIQYIEYMDFVTAMDALRGMKILKKDSQSALTSAIKVDFDRTKHMSDGAVAHRDFERKRLIAMDTLAADKIRRKEEADAKRREKKRKEEEEESVTRANRRQKREEKRKRKALTIFRKQEEDKVSMKIAREEQKLIKAQRQLESIRLLDELFDRIKIKVENNDIKVDQPFPSDSKRNERNDSKENELNHRQHSENDDATDVRAKKSKRKKARKEKKKRRKRKKDDGFISVSGYEDTGPESNKKRIKSVLSKKMTHSPSSAVSNHTDAEILYPTMYPRFPQPWYYETTLPMIYPTIGKGMARNGARFPRSRGRGRGSWRGTTNARLLHSFNPHLYNEQYYKYFAHLVGQEYHSFDSDYDKSPKSRSRSGKRSMSKSVSRSKSRSWSRSRRRKYRSPCIGRSRPLKHGRRSTSRLRSKSRSKSRSRSRSRSTSRSRSRSKSRSPSRRSKSHGKSLSSCRSKSKTRYGRRKWKARSVSRVKITRAKSRSMSPRKRSRSSSWSMPKSPDRRSCSWSKIADDKDAGRQEEADSSENLSKQEGKWTMDTLILPCNEQLKTVDSVTRIVGD